MRQLHEITVQSSSELIGYARVSTPDQSLRLQTDALNRAGCLHIHEEKMSGASKNRPALDMAIKDLREGDTLVVWRLDRLSRSMRDLYERLAQIREQGATLRSLQESFDFNTATGQLVLAVLGALSQFERQMTIERTKAGMEALRERGHMLGAPRKVTDKMRTTARKMMAEKARKKIGGKTVWRRRYTKTEVAATLNVSTGTIYNLIRKT